MFLTTHDLGVAEQLCDRVAFVVEGRIAALDTPTALTLRAGAVETIHTTEASLEDVFVQVTGRALT